MLNNLRLSQFLFLDIETVPQVYKYEDLPEIKRKLFEKKVKYRIDDKQSAEDLYEKAGIWAEFGKIIVISVGFFVNDKGSEFRLKSFAADNEKSILQDFSNLLNTKYFQRSDLILCAHNGKEFDFPYIARRLIINQLPVPKQLAVFGKKPWETPFCDTMELWRFGDYKHYTSLELLTHILKIPSPKQDIEGKDVAGVYYEEKNLNRIKEYCENDVIAIAQVMLRYMGKDLLEPAAIVRK